MVSFAARDICWGSVAQSVQFYDQFFATISERFSESVYETRSALSELVGRAVRLMPKEGGASRVRGELCVGHNDTLSLNSWEPDSNLRAAMSVSH